MNIMQTQASFPWSSSLRGLSFLTRWLSWIPVANQAQGRHFRPIAVFFLPPGLGSELHKMTLVFRILPSRFEVGPLLCQLMERDRIRKSS